jgi:2-keto-3-deoxy-L-fuconate dehydrogenase
MSAFTGLVAVVTGGASGIGAATARILSEQGARVAILDRAIEGGNDEHLRIPCDLTVDREVASAIGEVTRSFGGIDIVVNSAGIGASGDIAASDDAQWQRVLDVNVVGTARVSRAALPSLRESPAASIVNVCSAIAFVGVPDRAVYSASKGAVAALTLAMAADHLSDGVRVNAVAPGTVDTPWVSRLLHASDDPAHAAAALRARQPLGRLVSADEVAHAIAYLASPLSGSTTGSILPVDGGMASLRSTVIETSIH